MCSFGAGVPFVLREQGEGEFELIGSMDGELVKRFPREEIFICVDYCTL